MCHNSVLNVKMLVGTFNQSEILANLRCELVFTAPGAMLPGPEFLGSKVRTKYLLAAPKAGF